MPLFDSYGSPGFNLWDCKIARNNGNGTFGAAVDIPSVQLLSAALRTLNAELTGDGGGITAVAAAIIGGTFEFRFGSVAFDVFEILTGLSSGYSGSTPTRARTLRITSAASFPYFALCGRATAQEGVGDFHLFIPKCKLMEGFTLQMEQGAFQIPDIRGSVLPDPNYIPAANTVIEPIEYEATHAVTIPPTY